MYAALDWNYRITIANISPLIKFVKGKGGEYVGKGKEARLPLIKFKNVDKYYHPNLCDVQFYVYYRFDDELSCVTFEWETPDGVKRKQRVYLTFRKSNLGNGEVGYFICPRTGRLCRKLYTDGITLCSRYAFAHNYSYQNECRISRAASKVNRNGGEAQDRVMRHRLTYGGKPTRWAIKLLKMQDREREGWAYAMDKICGISRLLRHNL